jgi:hypothetical protein
LTLTEKIAKSDTSIAQAREAARQAIERKTVEFLANGGEVQEIGNGMIAFKDNMSFGDYWSRITTNDRNNKNANSDIL